MNLDLYTFIAVMAEVLVLLLGMFFAYKLSFVLGSKTYSKFRAWLRGLTLKELQDFLNAKEHGQEDE